MPREVNPVPGLWSGGGDRASSRVAPCRASRAQLHLRVEGSRGQNKRQVAPCGQAALSAYPASSIMVQRLGSLKVTGRTESGQGLGTETANLAHGRLLKAVVPWDFPSHLQRNTRVLLPLA